MCEAFDRRQPASSSQSRDASGLDDINEFEAELEAGDKWKRRFRLQREQTSDSQSSTSESSASWDEEDEEALLDMDETADEAGVSGSTLSETDNDEPSAHSMHQADASSNSSPQGDTGPIAGLPEVDLQDRTDGQAASSDSEADTGSQSGGEGGVGKKSPGSGKHG